MEKKSQFDSLFRLAIEAAPNGMIMIDEHGIIRLVNLEAERMFGYDREELIGKKIECLVPKCFSKDHPRYRQSIIAATVLESRPMGQGRELYGLRKDGKEIPVEIGLNPIIYENKLWVLSSIVDISNRKKTEKKLKEYAEELKRSNEELEQFAYIASHDLQEPLRTIQSYCEFLKEDVGEDLNQNAQDDLNFILSATRRMKNLIDDLLAFSRVGRQETKLENIDLNKLVADVVELLANRINVTQAKIEVAKLPHIFGDVSLLHSLFQNLLNNAMKFSSNGSPHIQISAERDNHIWTISVVDNGIGIDSRYFTRIFEPFQRLHPSHKYEGTGMGLAICKKVVERHHGRIWVESKVGEYSCFKFSLPAIEGNSHGHSN